MRASSSAAADCWSGGWGAASSAVGRDAMSESGTPGCSGWGATPVSHVVRKLAEETRSLLKGDAALGIILKLAAQDAGIAHHVSGELFRGGKGVVLGIY